MALQALKILLVFLFAAVQAEFDPLLADDCTGEECQIELRQLRGVRGAKDVAGEEPTDPIPAEDEAAPAATPATVAPADSAENTPVAEAKTTCTSLENHGSFSSAKVGIGTPPQHFELVADTGSDNVIVQSCICKEQRYCPQDFGKCFKGTGRSSTFQIEMAKNEEGKEGLKAFVMSFGSGDILVVKSSDKVEVGDAKAFMNQSLLLMVNQDLKIRGQFEGILGLGRPHRGENASKMVPGFMKLAGIERFSMCFNEQGPGVLGFNEPVQKDPLQSVGSVHWGLDFQVISVGESTQPLNFCQEKKRGMQSACGLIPDSGTTLITGPKDDIEKLYEGICLKWSRCLEMHQALQTQIQKGRSNLAQRSKAVRRMQAMLRAGSKDIIDVYDDELGAGPEYYDGDDYGYDYADGEAPDSPIYGDGEYGPDDGPDDLEAPYEPYEGPGPEEPPTESDPSFDGDLRIGGDDIVEPEAVAAEEAEEAEEEAEEEEAEEAEEAEGPMEPEAEDAPEEESGVVVEMPDNAGVPEGEAKAAGPDTAQPALPDISLASTFVLLMKHCYTWLGNSTNLDKEMPNLTFNVVGTAGGKEALKLDPNSYVFLTTVPIVHKEVEYFLGYLPVEIVTVRNQQVCLPAFSAMNYTTEKNGPIWIMGTPLFYSYKVQYDREPEPPTISFGKGCGTCREGTQVPPSAKSTRLFQQSGGLGRLRTLKTPPVVRKVDPKMGL